MLTLARSAETLSAHELQVKEPRMRWLVNVAHLALADAANAALSPPPIAIELTPPTFALTPTAMPFLWETLAALPSTSALVTPPGTVTLLPST
jgi:hypothetical protein